MAEDETFFARWSRRKRASLREGMRGVAEEMSMPDAQLAAQPAVQGETLPNPVAGAEDAPAADNAAATDIPADLPSIDDLTAQSDYSVFLREGVPAELRKLALRKLWASDPVLSQPEVTDLHNLDYTVARAEGVVATLYQVGRGMVMPEAEAKKTGSEGAADADPDVGPDADSGAAPDPGPGSAPEAVPRADGDIPLATAAAPTKGGGRSKE